MAGTSFSLTLPMRPMPPRITTPVIRAVPMATAPRLQPRVLSRAAAMELACTALPPPREAATQHTENHPARKGPPSPSTM